MPDETETEIALLKQQLAFEKEIRVAQAKEYERRLGELNHSHALAQETLRTYLTRDIYDRDHKELRDRIDKIELDGSRKAGQYSLIALMITVGLVLLTIVVNVFLKFAVK